jgi:hypothetical protein
MGGAFACTPSQKRIRSAKESAIYFTAFSLAAWLAVPQALLSPAFHPAASAYLVESPLKIKDFKAFPETILLVLSSFRAALI